MMDWIPGQMIPQYNTELFCDVYPSLEDFMADYDKSPFPKEIKTENASLIYALLLAKYGNNPIANLSIEQFKYKLFATIFQYAPTWEKRLEIQRELRGLSLDQAATGALNIYNHAFNDSAIPTEGATTTGELRMVNDQNVSKYKKSILGTANELWENLKIDVTEAFINKFKKLFIYVVLPNITDIYTTVEEE